LPLVAYTALDIGFTVAALRQTGRVEKLLLAAIFPLLHFCNGIGLLYGLLCRKPLPAAAGNVAISRVKSFEDVDWQGSGPIF
jgi:hypothetical protein